MYSKYTLFYESPKNWEYLRACANSDTSTSKSYTAISKGTNPQLYVAHLLRDDCLPASRRGVDKFLKEVLRSWFYRVTPRVQETTVGDAGG